ncbi:MAG TPA: DNA repair protein RecN [Gammaproteobacteria bacterium]|jgi:DNA repair protein RecN (Recombination protein N)|nr:DNA repair protein RecN [Gammaproteobacteria bacterium]
MLTYIHIRDFAIIETLELDLGSGLSVLTGETGAGKSILVDALGFVLGDRAESGLIRHGAQQAEVTAEFDLADAPAAAAWLAEQDLLDPEADGNCLLRRVLTAEGRSRGYVNGRPAPMQTLKAVGEQLVDIHGQHEHQSLLRPDVQMTLLDGFGRCETERDRVASLFRDWKTAADRLAALSIANDNRVERLDLLRYQVRELEALGLAPGEVVELDAEHARLANAGRLIEGCQAALDMLYENEEVSAQQLLASVEHVLRELAELDAELGPIADTAATAAVNAAEAADGLRHHLAALDIDPERLQWVESRIGSIHDLARKHRVAPEELPATLERLQAELEDLDQSEARLDALTRQVGQLEKDYRKAATGLHKARTKAAATLDADISAAMQELGMPGGRFAVEVELQTDGRFSAHGLDRIVFMVSANPGHPLRPLAKVASGGELSRIALAIQVIAARAGALPSLVFDEVDTGVGGGVAEIVGRKLRSLGEARQVLCVTHLPQVASQAHRHFRVDKQTEKAATRTTIAPLDQDERVEELARMLGGVKITDTTRKHAREMIADV